MAIYILVDALPLYSKVYPRPPSYNLKNLKHPKECDDIINASTRQHKMDHRRVRSRGNHKMKWMGGGEELSRTRPLPHPVRTLASETTSSTTRCSVQASPSP